MALILNKETIEATSVDESGNTLTTGYTHLNYVDIFGGINEDPYLIVDSVSISRINKQAKIVVYLYKDKNSRINDFNPIFAKEHFVNSDLFDNYFEMNLLEQDNVFKKSYEFINTIYTGWKSDE